MVLVIESSDPDAIHAISTVAKALKVTFRVEADSAVVSKTEQVQRMEHLEKFKGGLKKYVKGYQPEKQAWYEQ